MSEINRNLNKHCENDEGVILNNDATILKGLDLEFNEAMASAFEYFNDTSLKPNCKKSTFYFPDCGLDFFETELDPVNEEENQKQNDNDEFKFTQNQFHLNNTSSDNKQLLLLPKSQESSCYSLKRQTSAIKTNLCQLNNTNEDKTQNILTTNSTSFELDQLSLDSSRFKTNTKQSLNGFNKPFINSSSSSSSSSPSSSSSSRNGSIETPTINSSTLVKTSNSTTTTTTPLTTTSPNISTNSFKFTHSTAQLQLGITNNSNNIHISKTSPTSPVQAFIQPTHMHQNHSSHLYQHQSSNYFNQALNPFNIENELIKYTKSLKISRSYADDYKLGIHIRDGGFSEIYEGLQQISNEPVIIKLIPKVKTKNWLMVHNKKYPAEVLLHKMCNNINGVVKMLEFYEQDNEWIIVMPKIMNCVDLFDYLESKQRGRLSEQEACHFFTQLIKINIDLLNHGVVHRDLKSENLLVDMDTMQLVLIDFGASAICRQNSKIANFYTDFHGTKQYKPPEYITNKKYTAQTSTIWTLGILLYDMCNGQLPFENEKEILAYNLQIRANVSEEYKKILFDCLKVSPESRPSLQQLLEYPWIINNASKCHPNTNLINQQTGAF